MEWVAECHCGQLKAITNGEPDRVYVCHCQACQRRTGAVVNSTTRWLLSQVHFEGDSNVFVRKGASSAEIHFHFCPRRGSNVYWQGDRAPQWCAIAVGSFADPHFPPPTASVWEESKHPWVQLPDDTTHFAQGFPRPPSTEGSR